jgi:hypothetical protein
MFTRIDRFEAYALIRWEGEGGCMGITPQRGRDRPCSGDLRTATDSVAAAPYNDPNQALVDV